MNRFHLFGMHEVSKLMDLVGSQIEDLDCSFNEEHTIDDAFHPESEHHKFLDGIHKELCDRWNELLAVAGV